MKIILVILTALALQGCYSAKSLGDHPDRADKYIILL
jgi:hypothetical protein